MTGRVDDHLAAYVADLDIRLRQRRQPLTGSVALKRAAHETLATSRPRFTQVVYTAFDGDHFAHVPAIRRHAIAHHRLPINPESVVGYKDSVDAYGTKFGVLKADLAVLDKCDALWIYTDAVRDARDLSRLSEGVLLELLWFLDHHRTEPAQTTPRGHRDRDRNPLREDKKPSGRADVRIVPLTQTVLSQTATPRRITLDWDTVVENLTPAQMDLLERVDDMRRWGLPQVAFALTDPLDAKYADWIRAWGHSRGAVTIVPTLAIETADAPLPVVLHAWRRLINACDLVWTFPSVDSDRPPSRWVDDMMTTIRAHHLPCEEHTWEEVGAPKVVFGNSWPLSRSERTPARAKTELA